MKFAILIFQIGRMAMSEFITYIFDLLKPLQPLDLKRVFASSGLFYRGFMFALIKDEQLYVKADYISKALFIEAGCQPFSYFVTREHRRERVELHYYQVPESALDNQEDLLYWARLGIEASLRKNL